MASSTPKERPYHHGALREAALQAGRRLLADRSEDELSLREVAREVGVSPTAVYRHFPDKAALLRAIAAEGLQALADAQQAAAAAAGDGRPGLIAMGEAYVRFAVDNPALFRLIFGRPQRHDPMDRDGDGVSAAMAQLLDASSQLTPDLTHARSFALHSWAVVHGLSMLILAGQIRYDPAVVRAALRATRADEPAT